MNKSDLDRIANILLRCFIVTVVALVFVFAVVFVGGESIYRLQASMLGIDKQHMPMLTSGFLILIKCLGVTLFLFPWVAIRWFLHGVPIDTTQNNG